MDELIEWLKGYGITEEKYDIIDGYVVMRFNTLNLSYKGITHLPESIGNLKVERFYLSNNKITYLPESIGNLKVESISLSYNKLTSLPDSIGNLKLISLYLQNNKLTSLPDSIGDLKVESISLSYNNIPKESIKYLDRIEGLKVCNTDYFKDLNTNLLLSKINGRKDKIKSLID